MDQTTVTRNVGILEESGYIFSAAAIDDRRKRRLSVADKGVGKLEEVLSLWDEAQSHVEVFISGQNLPPPAPKNSGEC